MVKKETKNKAAKKAWDLYRANLKGKKSSGGSKASKAKAYVKKAWGIGRIANAARTIDILSAPAQGAYHHNGWSEATYENIKRRYLTKGQHGDYSAWKGIGTGLAQNYVKSRAGVYRGAGKLKIGSLVQAFSSELLAQNEFDAVKDFKNWNVTRQQYVSGYDMHSGKHSLDINTPAGKRFWDDKALNVAIGIAQRVIFNTNGWLKLNRYLPKDVNV